MNGLLCSASVILELFSSLKRCPLLSPAGAELSRVVFRSGLCLPRAEFATSPLDPIGLNLHSDYNIPPVKR
jgi:hypothetical protein